MKSKVKKIVVFCEGTVFSKKFICIKIGKISLKRCDFKVKTCTSVMRVVLAVKLFFLLLVFAVYNVA